MRFGNTKLGREVPCMRFLEYPEGIKNNSRKDEKPTSQFIRSGNTSEKNR